MSPDRGALRRQGRLSPSWIGIRAVAAVTPGLVVEACDWLVVTSARLTIRRHIWIVGVAVAVAVLGGVLLFLATRDEGLPRYLEGRWHDGDGAVVPDGTDRGKDFALGVRVVQGPQHCDWESVTFLQVAWPPGSVATFGEHPQGELRDFVRDLDHVLGEWEGLSGEFGRRVVPPGDVEPTGLHADRVELWIAASDGDAAYLRRSNGTFERWPRAEGVGCE